MRVLFNPKCSKCRTVRGIFEEQGVDAEYVRYLDSAPTKQQLEDVMQALQIDDPREMMRTDEPEYRELGLESADRDALLTAMHEHPILIQRPIVIHEGRAVIARPPERALELIDGRDDA